MTRLTDLHGMTQAEVEGKYGRAAETETFGAGDNLTEFRITIRNTYKKDDPASAEVKILEETRPDGDDNITVWYHSVGGVWKVFESLKWPGDAEF